MKYITALLVFFMFIVASFAQDEVLVHVDEMPYFPGCNDFGENQKVAKRRCSNNNLVSFIANNIKYPESAKKDRLEGTVLISFVIDNKGFLNDPFVLRDIGGGCGEAALDVVKQMVRWEPGVNQGRSVNVKLNLPIKFSLSGDGVLDHSISWGTIKGGQVTKKNLKNNIEEAIIVRDAFGNTVSVTELIFAYERKKKFLDALSKGHVNSDQRKLLKKVKPGGILTISATIQKGANFVEVDREFEIVK